MADEQTVQQVDFDEIDEPTNDNFVQLRNAYKQTAKEAKELRAFREQAEPRLREFALREAGFDPDSGPAKALLKLHDGELSADALKATAAEYGLAGDSGGDPSGTPPAGQQLSDEQHQAIQSTERSQQLQSASTPPVEPQSDVAALREAYSKGDLQAAYAINERRYRSAQSS